jgi:hypothetical protein
MSERAQSPHAFERLVRIGFITVVITLLTTAMAILVRTLGVNGGVRSSD